MSYKESILNIIGNETRRKTLALIAEEPQYISQIAKKLDITPPGIIRHILILEENGLIESYMVKNPLGAPRKYYRVVPSVEIEIALNPNAFKVTERQSQIPCPRYLEKDKIIEKLTIKINDTKDIELKAASARKLMEVGDALIQCEDFDKLNITCLGCHKVAGLRKNVAQIILDVSKGDFQSGIKTLSHTISQLFSIG